MRLIDRQQAWGELSIGREPGAKEAQHVSGNDLTQRYFANRTDGLRPPTNAEEFLVVTT